LVPLAQKARRPIFDFTPADGSIAFLLVWLDPQRHELTVVNAGHMAPMILRCDGRIEVIGEECEGPPLGIVDDRLYEAVSTSINPGDVMVFFTDGVNEAMDTRGQWFGVELLMQTLASAPCEAGKVGETIRDAVGRHAAGRDQSDDITLLCFGWT
jgi:serine phosphatase RsbU (regulator of sigma subunit)